MQFHSLIILFAAIISVIGKSFYLPKLQTPQIQSGSKDSTLIVEPRQHSGENGQPRRFWDWDFASFEFSIFPFFGPLVKSTTTQRALTQSTQKRRDEEVSTTNRMSISPATTNDNPNESAIVESSTNSDNIVTDDMDELVDSPTEETNNDTGDDIENFSDNDASIGLDTEESEIEEEMNTGDIIEGGN